MKKTIALIIQILFIFSFLSCGEEDGGKTNSILIEVENISISEVQLSWYSNSSIDSTFSIQSNDRLILFQEGGFDSNLNGERGILDIEPYNDAYPYDSVRVVKGNEVKVFLHGDCVDTQNPLCLENYEVIKDVNNDKTEYLELKFVIK